MMRLAILAFLYIASPVTHASNCSPSFTDSAKQRPADSNSRGWRALLRWSTWAQRSADPLKLARSMGFEVGVRRAAMKAIEKELDALVEDREGFVRRRERYRYESLEDIVRGLDDHIYALFRGKDSLGGRFEHFENLEYLLYAKEAWRYLLEIGNDDLLQALRIRPEQNYGFSEYYRAFYQFGIIAGKVETYEVVDSLAFAMGEQPGILRVFGRSRKHLDPLEIIKEHTSRDIEIIDQEILESKHREHGVSDSFRFRADIRLR